MGADRRVGDDAIDRSTARLFAQAFGPQAEDEDLVKAGAVANELAARIQRKGRELGPVDVDVCGGDDGSAALALRERQLVARLGAQAARIAVRRVGARRQFRRQRKSESEFDGTAAIKRLIARQLGVAIPDWCDDQALAIRRDIELRLLRNAQQVQDGLVDDDTGAIADALQALRHVYS